MNAYAHLKDAANGDVPALHKLTRKGIALATEGDEWSIVEALILARLAYARTGGEAEAGLLISTLAIAAELARSAGDDEARAIFQAENIAFMSLLADRGVAVAEDGLPALMDDSLPAAAAMAKHFRKLMDEGL